MPATGHCPAAGHRLCVASETPCSAFYNGGERGSLMRMNESHETPEPEARITPRLVDSFYTEAMLLADEARAYFDDAGRDDRTNLDPFVRVSFACESLKVTTRIMHI